MALGLSTEEVTEEYGMENGALVLLKRRETRKDVPPDLKAMKLLIGETDVAALSDEELEREKQRLLAELKATSIDLTKFSADKDKNHLEEV